jgi:hypothetical protein
MLKEMHSLDKYWVDVVHLAIYISNRSPTKLVKNSTPYEAWFAKKLSVSHLKCFGYE